MNDITASLGGSSITWTFPSNSSCSHIKEQRGLGVMSVVSKQVFVVQVNLPHSAALSLSLHHQQRKRKTRKSPLCSDQDGIVCPFFLALLLLRLLLSCANISSSSGLLLSLDVVPCVSIRSSIHECCQCSVNRIQNEHMIVLLV